LLVDVAKPERVHTAAAKPCEFEFLLAMACGETGCRPWRGIHVRGVFSFKEE
jgi:hypothetical protein